MLKTPSKFLQRPFLRDLLENRCLSPRGKEYCEEEVRDLLIEKEQRLALIEQERELSRINREAKESWVFQIDKLRNFHDQLINPGSMRGDKNLCQPVSHCEFSNPSIIFPLPENNSLCEDNSTTTAPPTERLQKLEGVETHHQPSIAVAPVMSGAAAFAGSRIRAEHGGARAGGDRRGEHQSSHPCHKFRHDLITPGSYSHARTHGRHTAP